MSGLVILHAPADEWLAIEVERRCGVDFTVKCSFDSAQSLSFGRHLTIGVVWSNSTDTVALDQLSFVHSVRNLMVLLFDKASLPSPLSDKIIYEIPTENEIEASDVLKKMTECRAEAMLTA